MAIITSKKIGMEASKKFFNEYQSENTLSDNRYEMAYKRVKRIKAFYVHVIVYVFVNVVIISSNYYGNLEEDSFSWNLQTFSTALFWGIGLIAHGLSVFGRNLFFGQNWEERKIQELMENNKDKKWE